MPRRKDRKVARLWRRIQSWRRRDFPALEHMCTCCSVARRSQDFLRRWGSKERLRWVAVREHNLGNPVADEEN